MGPSCVSSMFGDYEKNTHFALDFFVLQYLVFNTHRCLIDEGTQIFQMRVMLNERMLGCISDIVKTLSLSLNIKVEKPSFRSNFGPIVDTPPTHTHTQNIEGSKTTPKRHAMRYHITGV